jgi:leader peptidase (prepilin peptidase) / N-methyltransferase
VEVNYLHQVTQLFIDNKNIFYIFIFLVGLSVGSFINVVIFRLPLILKKEWRQQCHEFLELDDKSKDEKFTLSSPASSCPKCQHKIRIWENIPVISYIFLKGKCSSCNTSISIQYPAIEAVTAILSLSIAIQFGVSWQTTVALFLTWSLISLTMIDFHTQLLPDNITLPLLWIGLIVNMFGLFSDLQSSVIGAIAGYMILWLVFHIFRLITGKEGMGYGDFKLLAALGAWMGWQFLPQIIILSSLVGAVIGISMMIFLKHDRNIPIPFGPYLAIAGWIALVWGEKINSSWLSIS